jgi:hypothetical protein
MYLETDQETWQVTKKLVIQEIMEERSDQKTMPPEILKAKQTIKHKSAQNIPQNKMEETGGICIDGHYIKQLWT